MLRLSQGADEKILDSGGTLTFDLGLLRVAFCPWTCFICLIIFERECILR